MVRGAMVPRALVFLALLGLACGGTGSRAETAPNAAPSLRPCPERGVAVRVLGSGGPIVDDGRASSGYLLLVDGEPRLLVDAGGGVALRMAQAGVAPRALGGVLLSHVHVDHTADFVALLKSASFSSRADALPVVGPSGDDPFPALGPFLEAQLGEAGAWRYLGGYLREEGQPFRLRLDEVDVAGEGRELEVAGLRVEAVGVPHGPVPALGFVVHAADARVAFAGDQRLDDPRFLARARGADLLVAHHAIPEAAEGVGARLHARPSQIGAFARDAEVGELVLSHHMQRSLARLDEARALIAHRYDGPVHVAEDLDCYGVAAR
ncbi:MAG: MBL fold metallo-hydrolase [Sandaracinus sp.]|nr:MBL fold metallo-hydrolase [Sandaracinus sp.]